MPLTFSCPHCGEPVDDPKLGLFDSVAMARVTCGACQREFLIVDNTPVTLEQYRRRSELSS